MIKADTENYTKLNQKMITQNMLLKGLNLRSKQLLPPLGYYIASKLLHEIVIAINYLHCFHLPIIHRNIKPQNILIRPNASDKYVKITDLELAVYHDPQSLSHTQSRGTKRYMAPEVNGGRRYSPSADVYSLGVVIQEIFNFDINTIGKFKNNSTLFDNIEEVSSDCLKGMASQRPTCQHILDNSNEWTMK
ncbi:unnamed protein product [Oppiella nova]|uniref:Protein kinase domain-containing protein n=1 Tax=Oppiella nova TaxID=334625 RepID=A0A7R9LYE5_9ACAR|nr:unnamed protein product [Oppiella nova]CAG2167492.1 unnamed protein product [Oppiella nova]